MPATLMYGLYAAIQTNSLFSFEAAAGVFIAALFYLVTYLTNKSVYSLFASQCLLPFGLILLFEYLKIPNNYLLYALEFVAALYLYVAFLLKKDSLSNESDTNLFSAGALTVIVFLLGYVFRISSWEQYLFALMPILAGVGTAYIKKDINYGYLSTAFTVISTWVLFMQVLDLHAHPQYLAHIMTSLGVFVFLLGLQKNVNKKNNTFFKVNTIFFFIVSVAIANIHLTTQSITFGVGALLLFILFLSEKRKEYLYGTALLLNISLLFLLPSYKVKAPIEHYPLYFSAIGIAFYASSFFFRKEADTLKTIGIVNQVFTAIGSIYFYTQSYSHIYNYYTGQAKDTASNMTFLLSGYILTFLTIADSQIRKRANMDYLASFFALGTYVWQLSFWHVSQTLYYTIPIGIYMLCIGFLREAHHDEKDNANILNLLGCCILIIPTFFLSQTSGYLYSALVGALGLLLLLIGITAKNRIYQFSGSAGIILAIIPQTFQYLLSLPKWLIVGIIGLIFVGFAIFLLLRRKEK